VLTPRTWQTIGLWILVGIATPAHAQTSPAPSAPAPTAPAPTAPTPTAPAPTAPATSKPAQTKKPAAAPVPAPPPAAPLPAATPAPAVTAPPGPEAQPVSPQAAPDPNAPVTAPSDQEQMSALDSEARKRFELGRTFYEAGRFQAAAEEFGEAYRLSGRPQLLYNLYVAHRDAGHWPQATDSLRGYLEKVPDAPDRITLNARLEAMEAQNEVRKKEQAEADTARKRSMLALTRPVTVHSKVPLILAATGGALLVGSIITGVIAKNKDSDLDSACADHGQVCPSWLRDDVNKAHGLAIATDIMWTAGAVAALTGFVFWRTGKLDTTREVPVASLGVTQHGVTGSLKVRY